MCQLVGRVCGSPSLCQNSGSLQHGLTKAFHFLHLTMLTHPCRGCFVREEKSLCCAVSQESGPELCPYPVSSSISSCPPPASLRKLMLKTYSSQPTQNMGFHFSRRPWNPNRSCLGETLLLKNKNKNMTGAGKSTVGGLFHTLPN